MPIAAVAARDHVEGKAHGVRELAEAAAVRERLDNTVCAQSRPAAALAAAAAAVSGSRLLAGSRADAEAAAVLPHGLLIQTDPK